MASRRSTRASSSQGGGSAVNDSFASLDPEELLQMLAGEDDDGEEEEGRDIVTDLDGRLAGAIGRPELECGLKRKRGAGNEEWEEHAIAVPATAAAAVGGSAAAPPAAPAGAPQHSCSGRMKTFLRVRRVGAAAGPHSLKVDSSTRVTVTKPATKTRNPVSETFESENVMDETVGQADVYSETTAQLVQGLFEGRDGVVFAYGATNSGKSYSIWGPGDEANEGVIPRALREVYQRLAREKKLSTAGGGDGETSEPRQPPRVSLRVLEVYNNKAFCLLPKDGGERRWVDVSQLGDEVRFTGLEEHFPADVNEALSLTRKVRGRTRVNRTDLNATSSRAHTVFMVRLHRDGGAEADGASVHTRARGRGGAPTTASGSAAAVSHTSELFLVDLAGSERQHRSQSDKAEALNINLDNSDLFAKFKEMKNGAASVVCRTRTLTGVLRRVFVKPTGTYSSSFSSSSSSSSSGMNCVMIVAVHPAASEYGETQKVLSNLRLSSKVVRVDAPPTASRSNMTVEYGMNGWPIKHQKTSASNGGPAGAAGAATNGEKGKGKLAVVTVATTGSRPSSSSMHGSALQDDQTLEIERLRARIEQLEDERARMEEEQTGKLEEAEDEAFRLGTEEGSQAQQELEREVADLLEKIRRMKEERESRSPVGGKTMAAMAQSAMKREARRAESVRKLEKATTREADDEATRQSNERARVEEALAAALAGQASQKAFAERETARADAAEDLAARNRKDCSVERSARKQLEAEVAQLKTAATAEAARKAELGEELATAREDIARLENDKQEAMASAASCSAATKSGDGSGSSSSSSSSSRADEEEGDDDEASPVSVMDDFGAVSDNDSDSGDSPVGLRVDEAQQQLASAPPGAVAAEGDDSPVDDEEVQPPDAENESSKAVPKRRGRRRLGQMEAEVASLGKRKTRKPLGDLQNGGINAGNTESGTARRGKGGNKKKVTSEEVVTKAAEEEEEEPSRKRGAGRGKKTAKKENKEGAAAGGNETRSGRELRKGARLSKPSPEVVVLTREQVKNMEKAGKIMRERRRFRR